MKATKKIKKVICSYTYEKAYKNKFPVGFNIMCYTKKGEPMFNFFFYYDELNTLAHTCIENSDLLMDEIKRFLLIKGMLLTDKSEKKIYDLCLDIFNGYSSDFNKENLFNER